jgi:hypothetical protein
MSSNALPGIDFVLDSAGRKKAVLIDLRKHGEVWEDVYDALLAEKRRAEPRESLAEVRRRLKLAARRLRA